MNTLLTRPEDATLPTLHPPTPLENTALAPALRLQVQLGEWLIARAAAAAERKRTSALQLERRLETVRAHRERDIARFHNLGLWR